MKSLTAVVLAVVLAASAAASASAVPVDFIKSWTEAVYWGNIQGNPAYYYNGQAAPQEYYHALITATNQIAADQWVAPPPGASETNPSSYCQDRLWEYRTEPGAGYWPQTFASASDRYDSITMFDDFYGPVTYLWPSSGRTYQHPAGGYDRMIVCWTDNA